VKEVEAEVTQKQGRIKMWTHGYY